MSQITINSYEIKASKKGYYIPVVNNILLHSSYDPVNEAEKFIQKYEREIEEGNTFLVLGIGFGYHITELAMTLRRLGKENAKIIAIDPFSKCVEDAIALKTFRSDLVEIKTGMSVAELFSNTSFVDFLLTNPMMLSHNASINLFADYFRSFIDHKASRLVFSWLEEIQNPNVASLFKGDENRTIESVTEDFVTTKKLNKPEEFLLGAYHLLTSQEAR